MSQLLPWLGAKAEAAGVDVFTGFAASEALFDDAGAVKGVRLGDMGRARDGSEGPHFTQGADIHAPITVFAEGCRGSISKQLIARYRLDADRSPPTFALGFKELWQLPAGRGRPDWSSTRSAGRCHATPSAAASSITSSRTACTWAWSSDLDYLDPLFQPFEAFQRFKSHPSVQRAAVRRRSRSPTARAASPPAAPRRCRAWRCPARC